MAIGVSGISRRVLRVSGEPLYATSMLVVEQALAKVVTVHTSASGNLQDSYSFFLITILREHLFVHHIAN